MNFNVHRRSNSLVQNYKDKREARSLKKVPHTPSLEPIFTQAKQIYQNQGDLQQAVKLFHQFLGVNPRHNQALYLCAVSELKMGLAQNALIHLQLISDEYHNKPNAMLLSAMALNKIGKMTESLEVINDCIQRYDGFEQAICFRGKLFLTLKYYQKAQQDFKFITNHSKSSFLAHHSLGDCYRAQGKPEKALGPYLKGLQLLGKQENTINIRNQMELKVGICLYQLQRWEESLFYLEEIQNREFQKSCQYYYYLGGCQIKIGKRQQGLLHLEYCLRVQGNTILMKKAYKRLIEMYLQNYQFYEALNVVKLGDICDIKIEGWGNVIESFMLIIKGHYEDGVSVLSNISNQIKRSEEMKKLQKIKRQSSNSKPRYNQTSQLRRGLLLASPAFKVKDISKDRSKQKHGKMRYFSTKSVAKAIPKIESTRVRTKINVSSRKQQLRVQTEHVDKDINVQIYSSRQKEIIYPFILLFKAYGQFFSGSYYACLQTYEEYQNYIKQFFAKESDVVYNKTLCQGLLMSENDLYDDSLSRYSACIDIHYNKHQGTIPIEPLLYKIVVLVKLALQQMQIQVKSKQGNNTSLQILQSALDIMSNYKQIFESSSISLYFKGLINLLLGKAKKCQQYLDQGLKIAEDCSWKWLWVKGAVQIKLGNYYEAVKQFSAGLILQSRSQLFLGRSISFLLLSDKKAKAQDISLNKLIKSVHLKDNEEKKQKVGKQSNYKKDLLVQNCFQDLQKYIQMETDQQLISIWVSKILFCNGAFEEATRSLNKISQKNEQIVSMIQSISIYEGQFEEGGNAGQILETAFDGHYLNQEEENILSSKNFYKKRQLESFLNKDYEKWLITIHLFVKQKYSLLLKYLQRELFECEQEPTQSLLRYNVAIIYLLLEEQGKAINALKALAVKNQKISETLVKLQEFNFDQDQCIQELREQIGINCSKLISNYLPFRPVILKNGDIQRRIYTRLSIPFPDFPKPSLQLQITPEFIMQQIGAGSIEKKIEAPWIRRTSNQTFQFTEKLQESGWEVDEQTKQLKDVGKEKLLLE